MRAKVVAVHSNKLIVQAFIAALLAFVFSTYASAATAETKLVTKLPVKRSSKALKFGAALSIETDSTINNSEKKEYDGFYVLVPSVSQKSSGLSGNLKLVYSQKYTVQNEDNTDGDLSSPVIRLRKTIRLGESMKAGNFYFGPNFTIPAGREARRQTLNGATGLVAGVNKTFGLVSLGQELSYTYRFYRYDIRDNGVVNSPHAFASTSSAAVQINSWFGISGEFAVQQLVNFQGTPVAFSSASLGADFTLSESASISTGLATVLAGTISDDGQRNRFLLYDPGVTAAFLTLSLSI